MAQARRARRVPYRTLEQAAASLRVLAHAQRLGIVEVLPQRPVPVGGLATGVQLAPAAISRHLSQMRA